MASLKINFEISDTREITGLLEQQRMYNEGQTIENQLPDISDFYRVFTSGFRQDLANRFDISTTEDVSYVKQELLKDPATVVQRFTADKLEAEAKAAEEARRKQAALDEQNNPTKDNHEVQIH